MNRVIITGASGLLGQYLCRYFAEKYEVIGFYNTTRPTIPHVEFLKIDLSDAAAIERMIKKFSPHFIIHAAGYTSVDECEVNPQKAHEQNVIFAKNIREALQGSATKLVQISTDHLFLGDSSDYSEEAETHPLNIYAKTKLLAEQEVLKYYNALILRTSFYGGHTEKKMSFSSWIVHELNQGKKIQMVDDVFFTPISICSLADNIELLMNSNLKGIYNVVGEERLSKFEFAVKLADIFNLPSILISRSKIAQLDLRAKRPLDMSLSISKIKKDLPGFLPEKVIEGLNKIKEMNLI